MEEYAKALGDREHEQEQWVRPHLLMVSGDPTLLNLVRVLLDKAHYNVTTTNAVPLTFALIVAARPALLIVDLAITETSGWDLLVRLHTKATTAAIPVIITASDTRLLAHVARYPYLYGGPDRLVLPFDVDTLLDAIHALIGVLST